MAQEQKGIFLSITPKKSNRTRSSLYRISPDVALEHFGNKGLILLAAKDRFLIVNKPAASLLELIITAFEERIFSDAQLSALLLKNYQLTRDRGRREARKILKSWLKEGIFVDAEN